MGCSPGDRPSTEQFRAYRARLLDDLRAKAANGSGAMKVGCGARNTSDSGMLYALVQCTPDLTPTECDDCLVGAGQSMRSCDSAKYVSILLPSCNIRCGLDSFYNETRLREFQVPLPPLPSSPAPSPSPPPAPLPSEPAQEEDNTTKIVIIIVGTIVACLILATCDIVFLKRGIQQGQQEVLETVGIDQINTVEYLQYDFCKIRAATNDFADSNKLGKGGFGAVYKGILNGQEIAVKRLSKDSGQGNLEFKNEILLLAKLQHKNLVRLLGFSLEGIERLLMYEFVQNSSLDQFIFDPIKRTYLDWNSRYRIIGGIARGILYLHEDSRLKIIHRDLKASNILLDKDMSPKIADFGMARLFGQNETQGSTNRIVGTYGYMSPEYAMRGQFSPKSDVFSFGVLVLEILSGRKNSYTQSDESMEDLLSFVSMNMLNAIYKEQVKYKELKMQNSQIWKNWSEGTTTNVIDPVLKAGTDLMQDMLRCIHMGLLCVQESVIDRPTMASVVLMLNSYTTSLPLPKEPAFLVDSLYGPKISHYSKELNSTNASKNTIVISEGLSINSMSVTELYPR